ncbi:MAG: 30S ribosomal protein S12 methylthiotransferase RimO [Phycisphaerae bacterium]|nr:30S ribosomal protein S12 methylthiotransferase RimO [Phycisphaerae bacterium]MDW8263351.1 30S ribosomal protein S12 methylthiotransferase RimO [Phycisphaerales bacterium]
MARRRQENPVHKVAMVSLGCPKNLVDSERMLGLLAQDGFHVTADAADADVIVINTCGFLEASREESLQEIRRAVALKRRGRVSRVVVAGCLVQRHKTRLLDEEPGIDRLVGVFDREHIVQAVRGEANPRQQHGHYLGKYHDLSRRLGAELCEPLTTQTPETDSGSPGRIRSRRLPVFEDDRARLRLTPRHYAYLRISEGCNQGCAFCTIPSIRGPMRSKPVEQILAEARELAADGAVELNLIGQDTTSYGTDISFGEGLAGLLKALDRRLPADVSWVRLMYAYPSCFTDEMIDTIADCQRVVKYIDMPLQHISDRLLGLMKRRVTRAQIETLLQKLRRRVPGISIRTTFIAGSPTETEAEHQELVRFVRDFGFDMLGVFPYSPEPGTAMGRMEGQIPDEVKKARMEELMLTQQQVVFARNAGLIGRTMQVLVDRVERQNSRKASPVAIARHAGQAPEIDSNVFLPAAGLHPGQFVTVTITDYQAYDLVARREAGQRRRLTVLSAGG